MFVDDGGNLSGVHLAPGARPDVLQDALTGHILPLLWTLRGGFILHAAAVATPEGAFLILGPSGAGKSTLAASFEARSGCRVLDDDSALLEDGPGGFRVHPTGRGVSLWADSLAVLGGAFPRQRGLPAYGSKYRARRAGGSPAPEWPQMGGPGSAPLVAAFHLTRPTEGEPDGAAFLPMSASDKHLRLGRSAQRLDLTDRGLLKQQFAFLGRLIADVPLCRLRFPRAYAALPDVRQAVLAHVREVARR